MKYFYLVCLLGFMVSCSQGDAEESVINYEEEGYTPLYEDDLSQWRGQITEDPAPVSTIFKFAFA